MKAPGLLVIVAVAAIEGEEEGKKHRARQSREGEADNPRTATWHLPGPGRCLGSHGPGRVENLRATPHRDLRGVLVGAPTGQEYLRVLLGGSRVRVTNFD